jgi:hypothetical protein
MGPSLQRIAVFLLALALMLSCCQAQSVCSLSAGGYTYDLHSLGTVTVTASNPDSLFNIPGGYTSASINFCAAACSDGSYACLVPEIGDPVPLCSGEPTGAFLNNNSPQLGATFECTDSTPESRPLKGFVGSVKQSLMNN